MLEPSTQISSRFTRCGKAYRPAPHDALAEGSRYWRPGDARIGEDTTRPSHLGSVVNRRWLIHEQKPNGFVPPGWEVVPAYFGRPGACFAVAGPSAGPHQPED